MKLAARKPLKLQSRWLATLTLPAVTFSSMFAFAAQSSLTTSKLDPVAYDQLFPQYAELCAGSQYRDQVDGDGGPNGHAVLFLKGACRDKSAEYPQLKVCDNGPGVGISTYFAFKNVLWVATEGREFFINGGLNPNSPVTQKEIDQVIASAQKQGILKNVEMHDWIMKGLTDNNKWNTLFGSVEDKEHFKYRLSLGTDWALGLARNLYCTRIPMTKKMVEQSVAYLNEENRKAYHFEKGYEKGYIWDVAYNNCMHTAYNTLAAAGMWARKQIKSSKLEVLLSKVTDGNLSLAVPFDTFLRVAVAGTAKTLPDPRTMPTDGSVAKGILNQQWMLQQPGTMLVSYPIHENKNVYFNTDSPHAFVKDQIGSFLDITPLPIINPKKSQETMLALFADKANTDLETNLKAAQIRIGSALLREDHVTASDDAAATNSEEWVQTFTQFVVGQARSSEFLLKKYEALKQFNGAGSAN